jgi:hypothetical protein
MTVLIGLILLTLGMLELVINKRIAVALDHRARRITSPTRQNVVFLSIAQIVSGLALLMMQ